jgi:hypothetical protein
VAKPPARLRAHACTGEHGHRLWSAQRPPSRTLSPACASEAEPRPSVHCGIHVTLVEPRHPTLSSLPRALHQSHPCARPGALPHGRTHTRALDKAVAFAHLARVWRTRLCDHAVLTCLTARLVATAVGQHPAQGQAFLRLE